MWLDDLGGYTDHQIDSGNLPLVGQGLAGLDQVVQCAERGRQLIDELQRLISDPQGAPAELQRVNAELSLVDQQIEQLGFEYPALGLLTRMFVFAKENISGTEAAELASQMLDVYSDLSRRSEKLSHSYNML